jgi:hypothetical protein
MALVIKQISRCSHEDLDMNQNKSSILVILEFLTWGFQLPGCVIRRHQKTHSAVDELHQELQETHQEGRPAFHSQTFFHLEPPVVYSHGKRVPSVSISVSLSIMYLDVSRGTGTNLRTAATGPFAPRSGSLDLCEGS